MTSPAPAAPTPAADGYGPAGRSAWMDIDWREHQRWLAVDGHAVNVVDLAPRAPSGGPADDAATTSETADPVVFVHGLSGSWTNWLENLPVFARTRRVVALDLPGFGASPMPADGRISIPGYADLLLGVLDALGIPRAVIVGNSMGGFVGIEVTLRAPERVSALVLVASAGLDVGALRLRYERALGGLRRAERLIVAVGTMVATNADAVARRARLRRATMTIAVAHPEELPNALMAEQIRQGNGKPGFVAALEALTSHEVESRLGAIACPTLVYWGREDRIVPVKDAARFARLIPGARAIVLPDTGHMTMLERPARFNADVLAFLAGSQVGDAARAVTRG